MTVDRPGTMTLTLEDMQFLAEQLHASEYHRVVCYGMKGRPDGWITDFLKIVAAAELDAEKGSDDE